MECQWWGPVGRRTIMWPPARVLTRSPAPEASPHARRYAHFVVPCVHTGYGDGYGYILGPSPVPPIYLQG